MLGATDTSVLLDTPRAVTDTLLLLLLMVVVVEGLAAMGALFHRGITRTAPAAPAAAAAPAPAVAAALEPLTEAALVAVLDLLVCHLHQFVNFA